MYQGHNYTRVYVEEIGNFPSPAPVMKLMATRILRRDVESPLKAASPGRRGHRREDPKAREEGTGHQVAKHGRTDGPWLWDLLPKKSTCP
jgi:hypothetical protein